jgi:ABC-2 type transport system permease protein
LAGTWQLIFTLFLGFFVTNLSNISWFIKTGEMDFVLCKPVSALFYLSINRVELGGLSSMLSAIPALVIAGRHMPGFHPTFTALAAYSLLVLAGIAILYSMMLAIVSIAFWATRASAVQGLFWAIQEFGGYPAAIYTPALRWVLTFIIPVAIISNLPAEMLLKGLDWGSVALMLGIAAISLVLARFVFYAGLKRYQSASS